MSIPNDPAPTLVLASTSTYRHLLLGRLGVPFESVDPGVDEARLADEAPDTLALRLAVEKARSGARQRPGAWSLGSDQVAEVDGVVMGKPGTAAAARAQLARLAGRTHRLHTAVALVRLAPGGTERRDAGVVRVTLRMRALDTEEIVRYVEADAPLDCCGSYRIESRGIALMDAIETEDFTAIEGLPMLSVCRMLRRVGFRVP